MLKSLEKLREHTFIGHGCSELAEEIQAEIDKFYLPRPLFEDGEPVQFGDLIQGSSHCKFDNRVRFDRIIYYGTGRVRLDVAGGDGCMLQIGQRLERPPEPDTQEKIDEDSELSAQEYCEKRGINASFDPDMAVGYYPEIAMRKDLLARQRKLDGVED